ncbi:GNAT family N-acetyltransferase [Roseivirga misakiensis]|uniref:GNAT family N-acetyltransferase n=1 Tax=Roseivirga misakiensis TaxID=1563681 RepID=A0A1E5SK46_9BACT|nr:GNAT family N-acetyltransferase [Roseivirga misakiensis]OEJ99483.1 GNAT family N-acetyltransferase [Roseivirga misakiensis]
MIRVKKIENQEELEQAFAIRTIVFVEEQACPVDEEFDGFDEESVHFIAYIDGKPVGTSRYRTTEKGVKLERFAVLKESRGKGTGKRLVQTALSQISASFEPGTLLYLHAQLDAMPLYARYNFQKIGEQFEEAGIQHFKMEKVLEG